MVAQLSYNTDLRADITTHVGGNPKARVHSVEWRKIQAGDPVEINPSVGFGYKVAPPASQAPPKWSRSLPPAARRSGLCSSDLFTSDFIMQVFTQLSSASSECRAGSCRDIPAAQPVLRAETFPWTVQIAYTPAPGFQLNHLAKCD